MAIGMKFAAQQLTKKQMNLVKGGGHLGLCPYYTFNEDTFEYSLVNYEQIWGDTREEVQEKMDNYRAPDGYYLGHGKCEYQGIGL